MKRCEGYKQSTKRSEGYSESKPGLTYCGGIIWPWQSEIVHTRAHNGWSFSTHMGHKSVHDVMDELISQPLLGDY